MRFQLAIFDLDGTLVESHGDIAAALNAALAEEGLPQHDERAIAGMIGNGVAMLVERAVRSPHEARRPTVIERFRQIYLENPLGRTRLYEGLEPLLRRARAGGMALAVATNKPTAPARAILEGLGVAELFAAIVGEDGSLPRKPDPAVVNHIRDELGATREHTLYVGDSMVDFHTARAASVRVALCTWGYADPAELAAARADWLLGTPSDLAPLLLVSPGPDNAAS
jgi:phosphoglycolate phosphatase